MKRKIALSASYALNGHEEMDRLLGECDTIYTTRAIMCRDLYNAFPASVIKFIPFATDSMYQFIKSMYTDQSEIEWVEFSDLRRLVYPDEYKKPKPEESKHDAGPIAGPVATKVEELENLLATACRCIGERGYIGPGSEWPTDLNRWWIKRQEEEERQEKEQKEKDRQKEKRDHDLGVYYALKAKLGLQCKTL